jgi:D-glycero-D-manno-heptose 1,7-bisphosphate phosphatase
MGVGTVNAAVFLDRDGVLNQTVVRDRVPHPPAHVSACVLLPGVREACENLRIAGYLLFVVTNQPDVARGHQTRAHVEGINAWIQATLPVQQVLTCYHDNADHCACRKPKPGMLLQAAQVWDVALPESVMVGDRWSDVEAGRAAGCKSILIERTYSGRECCQPDWVVEDLLAAANVILRRGETA